MSEKFALTTFLVFLLAFGFFGYTLIKNDTGLEEVIATVAQPLEQTAGTFFEESVSYSSLVRRYDKIADILEDNPNASTYGKTTRPIRILIVPGHDSEYSGAHFGGYDEVDFNRIVADHLYDYLSIEKAFEVFLAHHDGDYHPDLQRYFEENKEEILEFREEYRQIMSGLVMDGKVTTHHGVAHNYAPSEVATKLYGINKWVNESSVDLVIHIHFNDYASRRSGQQGQYSGFSIYIPEKQYSNANASRVLANRVFTRLNTFWNKSNLPAENAGVIEDQELIAIGSYNTLDAASILIEYGYMYEKRFHNEEIRDEMFREMAFQTYLGVMDFFVKGTKRKDLEIVRTTLLPYKWGQSLPEGPGYSRDVLSLQALLLTEGYYPPEGESINRCPVSGFYGECTKRALSAYQAANGLKSLGLLGPETRTLLNNTVFE